MCPSRPTINPLERPNRVQEALHEPQEAPRTAQERSRTVQGAMLEVFTSFLVPKWNYVVVRIASRNVLMLKQLDSQKVIIFVVPESLYTCSSSINCYVKSQKN